MKTKLVMVKERRELSLAEVDSRQGLLKDFGFIKTAIANVNLLEEDLVLIKRGEDRTFLVDEIKEVRRELNDIFEKLLKNRFFAELAEYDKRQIVAFKKSIKEFCNKPVFDLPLIGEKELLVHLLEAFEIQMDGSS